MSPIYIFTLCCLAMVSAGAFWRGRAWERTTAAVLIAAWIGSALTPFDRAAPPWAAIAIDTGVFLFLLYAALFSSRRWTMAAAAFQFLVLATHLAFAINTRLDQWAYISAYYVWNLALIASLGAGVVLQTRRSASV